ncbi:MAG: hypothetical protein IPJ30_26550 [Acidobacteria bacterium]|nr:hypothetical protein [Acidobacteriota bacterium]
MLGNVRALLGDREGANELIGRLRADTTAHTSRAFKIAKIHLGLKEYDEAFRLLGEAIRERDVDLISIKSNPCWTRLGRRKIPRDHQNDRPDVLGSRRVSLRR